jgi:hypothetical protein
MAATWVAGEEQAAIRGMLNKLVESAPAAAGLGRAPALAWAGLRLAAMVLLAAGVGIGLGDGDEFDDVGCSVAQQPDGSSHGAYSAKTRERAGGKLPASDSGSAGSSGDGGPGGRPECEVRAAMCAHRMADGQCRRSGRQCRLFGGEGDTGESRKQKAESRDGEDGPEVRAVVQAVEAVMERFLKGQPLPEPQQGGRRSAPKQVLAERSSQAGTECSPVYVFRWTGRDWKVVFGGGEPFYLEDTLGGRYVNYLVHHPNVPISAFELEVAVQPEKGEARSRNSIQPESDPQALREYRQELHRLEVEKAQAAGEPEEEARLEGQIEALEAALKGDGGADTGERARDNVR